MAPVFVYHSSTIGELCAELVSHGQVGGAIGAGASTT